MASFTFPPPLLAPLFPELSGFSYMESGSYKSVYRVTAKQTNTEEVLKVVGLPAKGQSDQEDALYEQELGRVQRETSILGRCDSPYVVKLGSISPRIVTIDGHTCFAYTEELLQGSTLPKVIHENNLNSQKPTEPDVKKLLFCLVSAVQNLWEQLRVVHRDIKPGNIFATNNPIRPYVLIDLGIAYDIAAPGLTLRKSEVPHTPLYVAPEMLNANFRDTISYRSDLYSSALSAYEFAAGVHPLRPVDDDLRKTYTRVLMQEPDPLEKHRQDLSPAFCQLIDQLLKKSPPLRPANMTYLLNQFR